MIAYNGHEFSEYFQASVTVEAVYDASGRIVTAHRVRLNVKDIVVAGDCHNTDDEIAELKQKLLTAGGRLQVTGIGVGVIDTNDSETEDINNGPHPQSFNWVAIGHSAACEINWTCEATFLPCVISGDGPGDYVITSITSSVAFSLNEKGYTSRTVSGVLEIASSPSYSVDLLRSKIVVEKMPNGQRTQNYSISEDRRRLNFNITDREIESPNGYPAGVVSISAPTSSSIDWPSQVNISRTSVQITCRLELKADEPRARAWLIWNAVIAVRLGQFAIESKRYLVRSMTVSEDYYSNQYSFSMSVISPAVNANDNLRLLNYFAVVNDSWALWSLSMESAQRNRGLAQHSRDATGDNVVGACGADNINVPNNGYPPIPPPLSLTALCNPVPTRALSWVDFDAELIEAPALSEIAYTSYGESTVAQNAYSPTSADNERKPAISVSPTGAGYSVKIKGAPPVQRYIWKGRAVRLGYPIPPPTTLTVDGKSFKVIGTPLIKNRLVGHHFCQPVYEAVWNIGMVLDSTTSPTTIADYDPSGLIEEGNYSES